MSTLRCFTLVALAFAIGCGKPAPNNPPASSGGSETPIAGTPADNPALAAPSADAKGEYTLAVSIYAGWMPWYYANESGVLAKWAEKEGIKINVEYMDYIPSVEAYVAEQVDACVMTNMEALDMPAAAGIDTTAILIGDYSNGNDKLLVRGITTIADLKGVEVALVELSVSDYLLNRALESASLTQADVKLLNTSDSDIGPAFIANPDQKAVVTWNPIAMQIEQEPGVTTLYDSSKIPGEVLDLCVVNTATLKSDPRLGRALAGAWYEVLALMQQQGPEADAALTKMADLAGCSLPEYKAQLQTTFMYWTPASAVEFATSPELPAKMELVRQFCFSKGLLGEGAASVDQVGIAYPDGSIQGDKGNVKLRYVTGYMQAAQSK